MNNSGSTGSRRRSRPVPTSSQVLNAETNARTLPCVQRSVAEVQTSIGLVSNIIAQVIDCQQCQQATGTHGTKRRRLQSPGRSRRRPFVAMISDDGGRHVVPFLDEFNRFRSVLETANATEGWLLLTRIRCQRGDKLIRFQPTGPTNSSEILYLIPTKDTTIATISPTQEEHHQLQIKQSRMSTQLQSLSSQEADNSVSFSHSDNQSPTNDLTVHACIVRLSTNPVVNNDTEANPETGVFSKTCDSRSFGSFLEKYLGQSQHDPKERERNKRMDRTGLWLWLEPSISSDTRDVSVSLSQPVHASKPMVQILCGATNDDDDDREPPIPLDSQLLVRMVQESICLKWRLQPRTTINDDGVDDVDTSTQQVFNDNEPCYNVVGVSLVEL